MKRVLITGAGGSPAANFVRSLRKAPEDFYIVGTDASQYYLMRAETDARYLVPAADDPFFVPVLNEIIRREGVELVHAQNDAEVNALSDNRAAISAMTFLPAEETIRLCQDKYLSYERWQKAGLKVARTLLVESEDDLVRAFDDYGGSVWLRATTGAGGRGSLPTSDFDTAKTWLDFQRGWGHFTAAELLEPSSVTWMSLWHDGQLVVAQGRKRLYWELGKIAPSGISGATGGGVTFSDPFLDQIALGAVSAIDPRPEGLFGVDLTYDKDGTPNPTEINIGRFFTTHQFFTELGLNMPYIFVKLAYGEGPPDVARKLNPLQDGMVWIRGMDFLPVLSSMAEITAHLEALEELRQGLD
ncbi:MAG: carboxylate--amine ligase [Actinomycetota bacterium]|nr:carboxylate--amine ligase [Actinomycetota bacterium]